MLELKLSVVIHSPPRSYKLSRLSYPPKRIAFEEFLSWRGLAGPWRIVQICPFPSPGSFPDYKLLSLNSYLRHFRNGIVIALAASAVSMDPQLDNIRLLTLDEAAALLQVSKRTLQRMIKIHELPAFKVGGQWRLRETQLRQWVEQRESTALEQERKGS